MFKTYVARVELFPPTLMVQFSKRGQVVTACATSSAIICKVGEDRLVFPKCVFDRPTIVLCYDGTSHYWPAFMTGGREIAPSPATRLLEYTFLPHV